MTEKNATPNDCHIVPQIYHFLFYMSSSFIVQSVLELAM